jgi:hypothetical protein
MHAEFLNCFDDRVVCREEKTVRWLCDEAGQRYCSHFGRKPFLTLSSADGAILSADDVLSAVLSHDELVSVDSGMCSKGRVVKCVTVFK